MLSTITTKSSIKRY